MSKSSFSLRSGRVWTAGVALGARLSLAVVVASLVFGTLAAGVVAAGPEDEREDTVVRVMTQNMDEATDFGPVLTATSVPTLLGAVTATYLEVQASKIAERAASVAREIGEQRPTLVGLQEVSLWRTGPFNAPPATTVAFDQLQALLDALNQQGLHYTPIGIRTGLDAEAPSTLGFDVRVTDRDVMLVRADLPASKLKVLNVQVQNFATNVIVPNPLLGNLASPRGWIAVDAQVRGTTYRVVTTHLESVSVPVQVAQGNELLHGPAATTLPTIIAGDFNAAAAGGPDMTPTYPNFLAAGFSDTWAVAHPGQPGFTFPLHGEDPFTPASTPSERIDLILTRGKLDVLGVRRVGNTTADLTPSGLWPSDHAGVSARLQLSKTQPGQD